MKKFLIGMCALALCLGMNSCKKDVKESAENNNVEAVEAANEKEAEATEATEKVVEEAPSLADIVAKAKAEGANWSIDEWKEQFKKVMIAIKPMMIAIDNMTKKIEADPTKAEEALKEAKEIEKQNPNFSKLLDEFTEIASATENGKKVVDDEEWNENMMKELGVPHN